jgi:hypothetical protein
MLPKSGVLSKIMPVDTENSFTAAIGKIYIKHLIMKPEPWAAVLLPVSRVMI